MLGTVVNRLSTGDKMDSYDIDGLAMATLMIMSGGRQYRDDQWRRRGAAFGAE